ncbi:amino acid adenylation domain-containing protein [Streptomyces sp. NPDC088348]|uniref:non-ribosomal peptide synthetase n=1 Tax=Streptomyces sp. NPDC088348 TaxID=3365853 RepID=UPI003830A4AA
MPKTDTTSGQGSFPLSAVQRSYRIGRQDEQPMGGTACHMYFEFDGARVDPSALAAAVETLQIRHPLLCARFPEEAREGRLGSPPTCRLVVYECAESGPDACAESLSRTRAEMSTQKLDVAGGQMFDVRLTVLPEGTSRLHVDVDLLAADPPSIRLLLADLAGLYTGTAERSPVGQYATYRQGEGRSSEDQHEQADQQEDRGQGGSSRRAMPDTWKDLFEGCEYSSPRLPLTSDPQTVATPVFERRNVTVSEAQWQDIVRRAAARDVDPDSVLLAAFAHTLARWSENSGFLLNLPVFDRPCDPDLRRTVGDFTRLTILPLDLSAPTTLEVLVQRVEDRWSALEQGANTPSLPDVQAMAQERGERLPPLGIVYTSLTGEPWVDEKFEDALGTLGWMQSQTPQVWLDCIAYEYRGGRRLAWDVVAELFPPGMHEGMTEFCGNLLRALADEDWSHAVPAGLPSGQRASRDSANATRRETSGHLLHEQFFAHAAADPGAPALFGAHNKLSRGELTDTALRMAGLLRSRGLRDGEPVAVTLTSGMDQICAVLGVLAAGGCYVSISPEQPQNRRDTIHDTAGIRYVIRDEAPGAPSDATSPGSHADATVLTLDEARRSEPLDGPAPVPPNSPAYIIFTSGSTGKPKGVQVSHQSVVNSVEDINERWAVGPDDCGMLISSLDFDLSVYEIFGPLSAGGAVAVPDADDRRDPHAWLGLMDQHGVTMWDSVPVLLDMLISTAESDAPPRALRLAMTGGDWIGLDLPARLNALLPECRFVACGGATEGSVYSNYFEVETVDPAWLSIPYGRPLGNQTYRVADPEWHDCPDWVAGELWIGGAGVADGYVNDPERTSEHFVEYQGERWYRTGDLGRYRADGVLEFLGRTDHQVKINGYRIELGEIESAIAAHDAVARCVAVVAGENAQRRLVAYVVPEGGDVDLAQVKSEAAERLAEYARPADYFLLTDLPLGSNGKVDRKALASWALPERPRTEQEPPEEGTEQSLAEIWSDVLSAPVTSRHDNFFDIGGNSLLAAKLTSSIRRRYDKSFSLRALLRSPTLTGMAEHIDHIGQTGSAPVSDSAAADDGSAHGGTRRQPAQETP